MSIRLPSYKIARKGTTTCIILWGSFSLYWLLYYKCVITNIYDLAPIWWPLWQTSDCCYVTTTVWSNMIVLKVFSYKTLKIEFRGSIFDLNSTQVWAIMCKSAIIKINSLFHQNLGTINECSNWREPQTKHLLSITILKIGPCLLRFLLILYSWAASRDSKCGQFTFFELRA